MMLPLLLLAAVQAGPPAPAAQRLERCVDLAAGDPPAALAEAAEWRSAGGGFLARQCLGMAYAAQQNWVAAASEFDAAARAAEAARDSRAANYWAQAGNAWLAAADPAKAQAALDAALAAGTLTGLQLGEAHLDRARALVAGGAAQGARADLDQAIRHAPEDPLVWLLSATLARRAGDLPRARKDIAAALDRSGDDASVQLEAGNIAALQRDESGAKTAWNRAVLLAPDSDAGRQARAALAQFAASAAH